MIRFSLLLVAFLSVFACNTADSGEDIPGDVVQKKTEKLVITNPYPVELSLIEAAELASMPLKCLQKPYPNKLGQVIGSKNDLKEPQFLHPAFYGCFDWHSAVHGHWSLVKLLKMFPELPQRKEVIQIFTENLTSENIAGEILYFQGSNNSLFERTYGWAWLLKLQEELSSWDHPMAATWQQNLEPLADLIVDRYTNFLPKLIYPIRVGEHKNTAFGLSFAHDFAVSADNAELKKVINETALRFYFEDENCPLNWEPSGYDFLSPCLEEANLMMRVLPEADFLVWLDNFLPQLSQENFDLEVGKVESRDDGTLVHLDGLNFSRAWTFLELSRRFPKYGHLANIANKHINHSLNLAVANPHYEGEHWVGSFAVYALSIAFEDKVLPDAK